MWIEIFRGGRQTDSRGAAHDGDALIDAAVATFDAGAHRPPLVLGHPANDSPAYGWVNALKAKTTAGVKRLMADIEPVEALRGWVNARLYRNRSAAFYHDGRLRHVGFLGGTPPAVKGLSPLPAFADGADDADAPPIEFATLTEPTDRGGNMMKFSDFLQAINIFKKLGGRDEDIDLIAPPATPSNAAPPPGDGAKTFTEADVAAAKAEAAEQARAAAAAEFAEREAQRAKAALAADIAAFCEAGVKDGRLAPAWVEAGLAGFMGRLPDGQTDAVAFAEGGEKQTPQQWFRAFLAGLPKLVAFDEIATRDKRVDGGDAGGQLQELVRKKLKDNPNMGFTAAFSEAQREHPDLAAAYAQEIGVS